MTTDIDPQAEPDEEEEEESELMPDIYVEKASGILFEVKFFIDFIIVRPATPSFYTAIRKISPSEFAKNFEEFCGDNTYVRLMLRGAPPQHIVEYN